MLVIATQRVSSHIANVVAVVKQLHMLVHLDPVAVQLFVSRTVVARQASTHKYALHHSKQLLLLFKEPRLACLDII